MSAFDSCTQPFLSQGLTSVTVLTHSTAVAGGWHDPPIYMTKNHSSESTPHLCCHITPRLSRL